jgi:hypothetical protein
LDLDLVDFFGIVNDYRGEGERRLSDEGEGAAAANERRGGGERTARRGGAVRPERRGSGTRKNAPLSERPVAAAAVQRRGDRRAREDRERERGRGDACEREARVKAGGTDAGGPR